MSTALSVLLGVVLLYVFFSSRARIRYLSLSLKDAKRTQGETEQRLSQEIADQAKQQEALFDRMFEGVLILDGNGRVRFANSAVRHLFELSGEVQGKVLIETIRSHELQEIVQLAAKEGQVIGRELVFMSGLENRYFSINAADFKELEAESGIIVIFHDITQIKLLESGRKEFVANVSHELRTPLSMIKGYVETVLEGNVENPGLQERFLRKIHKHSDRLTYLIEDLLVLSQLESNQIALSCGKLQLSALVRRVFDDLQDRAKARSVALISEIDKGIEVWADADRILQVVQNLVDNGIKYGSQEREVRVTASQSSDSYVTVQVANDGPGIPEEAQERIFERFFRVDKARSREQGGTGLGLAIVKHIVQAHGGRVWLESSERSGTMFSFTVPSKATIAEAAAGEFSTIAED
ncbi:MAG: Alkaline phosphatase synthesis sensor protein PhoR [Verrucomicrobia subdivision 3 bacterium]|nr:Alkaline phosphatase synthesis sensor protein PhoR [Limisphaerales bacterium]MCS1414453.1 Alkaline phosphatase synthesis sensor protein PhoR [Limisphaerales bacterium]